MMTPEFVSGKSFCVFVRLCELVGERAAASERADKVERELFAGLLELGRELLNEFFIQAGDGDIGPHLEQSGQILNRLESLSARNYLSVFGKIEVQRCVYAVRERQATVAPLDERLGMPAREHSYVLQDFMQQFCVNSSFDSSVNSLKELFGISISKRTAELLNQDLGEAIGKFRDETKKHEFEHEEEEILVASLDGKGVPMRGTVEQRRGISETPMQKHLRKRREGKADTRAKRRAYAGNGKTPKQMAWVGAVFTVEAAPRTCDDILNEFVGVASKPRPRPVNKRIEARMTDYIEGARVNGQDTIFEDVAAQVMERDQKSQKTLICIMDGQNSLWERQAAHLPRAIPILDIFHVSERLWKAAYCFHRENSPEAEEFVIKHLKLLLQGRVASVVRSFRARLSKLSATKKTKLKAAIRYYHNNKALMKYDEYLAKGYPIASGVIEGTCRNLINDRMERTGMRWHIDGAQAMLNTRSAYINGEWKHMIENRIILEQKRLYGQAA